MPMFCHRGTSLHRAAINERGTLLGETLKYVFQKWRTKIPTNKFICNTWDISGTKHQNILRWLGFAHYKASGRGHINSVNLVNVRNFGNSRIPVPDGIFPQIGQFLGAKCRSRSIFSEGGPRLPENNAKQSIVAGKSKNSEQNRFESSTKSIKQCPGKTSHIK